MLSLSALSPADNGDDRSESILAENHVDGTVGILSGAGGRKPMKTGMKELAVMREKVNEQQRQMGKVSKAHHNHEDSKKSRLSTGRVRGQGCGELRGAAVGSLGNAECRALMASAINCLKNRKNKLKEKSGQKQKRKSKHFWPDAGAEHLMNFDVLVRRRYFQCSFTSGRGASAGSTPTSAGVQACPLPMDWLSHTLCP